MDTTFNFSILLRRKRAIVLSGIVVACGAFGISKLLPVTYTSTGSLLVENSQPSVPELGMVTPTNNDIVLTQVEVLRDRGLIEKVVRDLKVSADDLAPVSRLPGPIGTYLRMVKDQFASFRASIEGGPPPTSTSRADAAIDYVQKHLSVSATDRSSVISLAFQAGSPDLATQVLDTLMKDYLAGDSVRRDDEISHVNDWLTNQGATLARQADDAETQVQQFIRKHNLPQVQGSSNADIQLGQDQAHLAVAKQELAHQQAVLAAISHDGSASQGTLDSKTIQSLKENEAKIGQSMSLMSPVDPRRIQSQLELRSIRDRIASETAKIGVATRQNVSIAAANVQTLQAAVDEESKLAQGNAVDAATLAALKHNADAKRQLYIAFGTRTEQNRLAAANLPSAGILYHATVLPTYSSVFMSLMLGLFGGMLGASGLFVVKETLNSKVYSTLQMEFATGVPLFGSLPEIKGNKNRGNLLLSGPPKSTGLVVETLRAMYLLMQQAGKGTTVVVTSSEIGEGKTTVAAALARIMAADNNRVLLIDADLRRPRVSAALNLRSESFLESVVSGTNAIPFSRAVVKDPVTGVYCLLSNGSSTNPMRALASDEFRLMLDEAKHSFDFVILDSPPVLRVVDATYLSKLCHYVLFIVEAGRMEKRLIAEAISRFQFSPEEQHDKLVALMTRVAPRDLTQGDYFSGYERLQ